MATSRVLTRLLGLLLAGALLGLCGGCAGRLQVDMRGASGFTCRIDWPHEVLTKTDSMSVRYADGTLFSVGKSDQTPLVNAWAWGKAAEMVGNLGDSDAVEGLVDAIKD